MIKRILSIAILAAALLAAGCASLPSTEEMKKDIADFKLPVVPESKKAIVYIVRPSGLGGLVRFNIYVDDHEAKSEMGFNRGSQYIYFTVTPGEHKIYSLAENWAEINITAKENEVIFLQQDPSFGILFAQNNLLKIEELVGMYHVKRLELGTIIKTEK